MENHSDIPDVSPAEGADQGPDCPRREGVREDEVHGRDADRSDWPGSGYGGPLDDKEEYVVQGKVLNALYHDAVNNFNRQTYKGYEPGSYAFTYAQAFWNGYGSAIRGIRETVWPLPDYKYLLPKASDPEVP